MGFVNTVKNTEDMMTSSMVKIFFRWLRVVKGRMTATLPIVFKKKIFKTLFKDYTHRTDVPPGVLLYDIS